jgi:hypothetical protein
LYEHRRFVIGISYPAERWCVSLCSKHGHVLNVLPDNIRSILHWKNLERRRFTSAQNGQGRESIIDHGLRSPIVVSELQIRIYIVRPEMQIHLVIVFEDRDAKYIEDNTMSSRHACYGAVSYRVGSAGPMLVSM